MEEEVSRLIDAALAEDIGPGDVTSGYFVAESLAARAMVIVRESGVVAGLEVAAEVFRRVDPRVEVTVLRCDGMQVEAGAQVMEVRGEARSLLTAERTALNFLQRLSGVATLTARYVAAAAAGGGARILDTRKTTPGWRWLEKAAVRAGGGTNHRMGLYDRAMVKDNHLCATRDVAALQSAIRRLKAEKPGVEVELEADTLEQVWRFLELDGVDIILLDNMSVEALRAAVARRGVGRPPRFEASGGVRLDTVAEIAATGVDEISVGALTHSAVALDLGLDFAACEV